MTKETLSFPQRIIAAIALSAFIVWSMQYAKADDDGDDAESFEASTTDTSNGSSGSSSPDPVFVAGGVAAVGVAILIAIGTTMPGD